MKIDKPENPNYAARVITVKNIITLENCDNVVAIPTLGLQAIVSKDTKVGDMGIVFPTEAQLSDKYCYNNNLFRHGDKNKDPDQKGYIEDNRRIRAQKFRGHVSNALFMPLDSLKWAKINPADLQDGDEFDVLNGEEICRKYVVKVKEYRGQPGAQKRFSRVDGKHMPEHYDTENYWRNKDMIEPGTQVIVTQKLHGTSIRVGNTIVKRKLNIVERILSKLGVGIQMTEHDYIFGSRKVVKDANNPDQVHYYASDIWTLEGKKLEGLLPENYLVFAELLGYTPEGAEIQRGYSYGIEKGQAELYIYRIAIINDQGIVTDLSWDHIKEFCALNGLKHVPEIWRGPLEDLVVEDYMDKRYLDEGMRQCLSLGENKDVVDEGVCVRVDNLRPYILKAKSPKFLEHETKLLDTGEEDLESQQVEEVV